VSSGPGAQQAQGLIVERPRPFAHRDHDVGLASWLVAGVALAAMSTVLTGCGSAVDAALQSAVAHPDSIQAASYVDIRLSDLPDGYTSSRPSTQSNSEDAAQTLAEYKCEHIDPPDGRAPLSVRTPDFVDPTERTEVHETTAVFASAPAARAHLDLELNSRYPACKAAAFRRALVADAPTGERIGFVAVHVTKLPSRYDDVGIEVVGLSTLLLPGGVSTLATSDLVVLTRDRMVAELSIDTDGPAPTALLGKLTADLSGRLAQVLPGRSHS
jgi:hypothetical protein